MCDVAMPSIRVGRDQVSGAAVFAFPGAGVPVRWDGR